MNVFIMQNSIVRPLGRGMQNVLIGFVGEHEARTFFVRTRDDLTGYTISLVIGDVDCGAMTKAPMPDGSTMLSLTLTSDMLGKGGDKVCQLLMTKDTIVRKSSQFRAYVGASNDINSTAPDSATIIIISEKITELVHDAALDAIAEVQEVIDSIPADYSALSAQVDTNTEDIDGLKADLEDNVNDLKSAIKDYNTYPVSNDFFTKTSETHNGVTYTWQDDGTCIVTGGTTESESANILYNDEDELPIGINAGEDYAIVYKTSNENVRFGVIIYKSNSDPDYLYFINNGMLHVPDNCVGIGIRLHVTSGTTFSEDVTISVLDILNEGSSFGRIEELKADVKRLNNEQLSPYAVYKKTQLNPSFKRIIINEQGRFLATKKNYASTGYIHIPDSSAIHIEHTGTMRIALYDIDKSCVNVHSIITDTAVEVSSSEAKFVAFMFYNIGPDNVGAVFKECSIVYKGANNSEYTHSDGKTIRVNDASKLPFKTLSLSGNTQDTKITVSSKNLFWQDYVNTSLTSNGVTFGFDKINSSIRVYSATGATANAFSATDALGSKFQKVNNVTWWHNFKFCFGEDTVVTFSGNMSQKMPYDSKIRFDIYDGSVQFSDDGNGITFVAKAGREYGIRIVVLVGWKGDVTFYPQLEIGSYRTAFEPHSGGVFPSSEGSDNIFSLNNKTKYKSATNGVTIIYDCASKEIRLNAAPSSATTITNYSTDTTVNGLTWIHIFKWVGDGKTVWVSGIPESLIGKVRAQISDGTNTWVDTGYGVSFETVAGTEYAYRLYILNDQYINDIVRPVIATNLNAVKMCGGKNGITNVFVNDSTVITLEAYLQSDEEKIAKSDNTSNRFNTLTGWKPPFARINKRKPMVSFIDDDTTSIALVQRYHAVMASKGVVGGFAVETRNLDNNEGLPELLLDYEEEGYACLYHCYYQRGDATRYWEENNPAYDEGLIKENFMRGLRSIKEYGFSKYNHWVTPYGVNGDFIQALARNHGMESLMTMGMTFSDCGYMSIHGNVDRYNIPRITLNKNVDDKKMHALLEGCVADNGWIIFMTHANTWTSDPITKTNYDGTSTTYSNEDAYIAHVVQQCLDLNMDVVPYTEAFEWFKPVFYLNELL